MAVDQKIIDELSSAIVDGMIAASQNEVNKAQYDKSYRTSIYGVNQVFVSGVTSAQSAELIKTYAIPKSVASTSPTYYTVKLKDKFYCVKSPKKFSPYEEVMLYIPNNDWSRMYIDKVGADKASGGSVLDAVEIDGNEMYYNGETYYLQFGYGKRIMCVTHGDHYHICTSMNRDESLIEAATAVLSGLKDAWDCEFDLWVCEDEYNIYVSNFFGGNNMPVPCDVKVDDDDTITLKATSDKFVLNKGVHRIKVKFEDNAEPEISLSGISGWWSMQNNNPLYLKGYGAHVFVNNKFKKYFAEKTISGGNYVSKICFGENISVINSQLSSGSVSTWAEGAEYSVPPKVITINSSAYKYVWNDYVYIPKTCTGVGDAAFMYARLSEVEIAEDGDTLTFGGNCFYDSAPNSIVTMYLPGRVNCYAPFISGVGLQIVKLGSGISTTNGSLYNDYNKVNGSGFQPFDSSNYLPVYLILPKTLKTINAPIVPSSTPNLYIYYEGSESDWNAMSKASGWDRNIANKKIYYNSYPDHKLIEKLLKEANQNIKAGTGLTLDSGVMSLKQATNSVLGGIKVGNTLSINNDTGVLNVKSGDNIQLTKFDFSGWNGYVSGNTYDFSTTSLITAQIMYMYGHIDVPEGTDIIQHPFSLTILNHNNSNLSSHTYVTIYVGMSINETRTIDVSVQYIRTSKSFSVLVKPIDSTAFPPNITFTISSLYLITSEA